MKLPKKYKPLVLALGALILVGAAYLLIINLIPEHVEEEETSTAEYYKITDYALKNLDHITFTYDDALVAFLTHKSFSRTYGARNLRRTIQKELEDPMATRIIDSYESPITQVKATVEDEAVKLYTL